MVEPLWTIKEVAGVFGVCEKTVRQTLIPAGLPYVRPGKQYRFEPSEVQAFLNRQRQEAKGKVVAPDFSRQVN